MCGICGIAYSDRQRPAEEGLVRRMSGMQRHRGPDGEGLFRAPGIGLGVRRLSIVDPETGGQPIANEDGAVTLVCNGMIYNHRELRGALVRSGHRFRTGSDVEVIVHLYEDHGPRLVERLRGMFAFALWDRGRGRLLLARDRLGIKPLHFLEDAHGICFGSEQKAILAARPPGTDLDLRALYDLFTLGFIADDKTLFPGIRRLSPGSYLLFQGGALATHRYWEPGTVPPDERETGRSPGEWAECIREKLEECVRVHLRSDRPVGAWLSPGLDSSGVVGLMARITGRPVHTFGLAFEDGDCDEFRGRKTLVDFPEIPVVHHPVMFRDEHFAWFPEALWHSEDPFTAGLEVVRLVLAEATAASHRVVLTGEGADEVFGGYPWYRGSRLLQPLLRLPPGVRRSLASVPPLRARWPGACRILAGERAMSRGQFVQWIGAPGAAGFPRDLFSAGVRGELPPGGGDDREAPASERVRGRHPFRQLQHYDLTLRLPANVVHSLDRMSMARSLEARVPFLDHELVELCAGVPPALMVRGRREKQLLRDALRPVLPRAIAGRRKRGLRAPFGGWFRGDLPEFAREALSRESLLRKGTFNPDAVARMLDSHRNGRGDHARHLLGVLGVQLWDEAVRKRAAGGPEIPTRVSPGPGTGGGGQP